MLAVKHSERLHEIQENIKQSCKYFEPNVKRFQNFVKYVFDTCLTGDDVNKLRTLQKPVLEFNILESIVSRLMGEFSKHEPAIEVRVADGIPFHQLNENIIDTVEFVEGYLRERIGGCNNGALGWHVYKDLLSGGYSVVQICTDYIHEMSFDQNIKIDRVFDPTLTGFDPLAREAHKGDGQYCFMLFPMTRAEFKKEFPNIDIKKMKFQKSASLADFNWSYKNQEKDVIMVADYYEKKNKKVKIVKLANGYVATEKEYEEFLLEWEKLGNIEQPPAIVDERFTSLTTICRYRLCETEVLEYKETDFKCLPLIFVSGNSVTVQDGANGASYQMTRPFVFHALGIQKLKNFCGQTIGQEIENMVQHKFVVAVESIPEDYQDAYQNVQLASVLIYNAFYDKDPSKPLPPPREIQRTPTPPIIESTFMGSDQVTQTILGSYDSVLGTNDKQISGVAIQQGAMQSNAAAIPYLMGYIEGLNRIAYVVVDLIPKYIKTPRTIPIIAPDGKRAYQIVNHEGIEGSVNLEYDSNSLQVNIQAGVGTNVQKQVALDQMITMMQVMPAFAEFINSMGLEIVLDNMDIRGIDTLKMLAVTFMQQQEDAKKAAAENPPPDPLSEAAKIEAEAKVAIEMAKLEQKQLQAEGENAVATAKVAIEKEKVDIAYLQLMATVKSNQQKAIIEQEKIDAENARSAVETAISVSKHHHERDMVTKEIREGE